MVEKIAENTLKLDFRLTQKFELSHRQREFVKMLKDETTSITFCKGPAGTSKTYLAIYAALHLIKNRSKENIMYVRSAVESSDRKMGFLPGEEADKFRNYTIPFFEKMNELISENDYSQLINSKVITFESTCFMRGRTFTDTVVIIDEAQNLTRKELLLLLSRIGKNSKLILLGDYTQSDIKKFDYRQVFESFEQDGQSPDFGITFFEFTAEDVVRSPIIKHIVRVFEGIDNKEQASAKQRKEQRTQQQPQVILGSGTVQEWNVS